MTASVPERCAFEPAGEVQAEKGGAFEVQGQGLARGRRVRLGALLIRKRSVGDERHVQTAECVPGGGGGGVQRVEVGEVGDLGHDFGRAAHPQVLGG